MSFKFILFFLIVFAGCATSQIPDYIKADHPYVRKVSGDYNAIISAVQLILSEKGWDIQEQVDPSVYERREGGEDQSNDVLLFTKPKRYSKFLYSTYTHFNVYVHATADGAEVDIRYEVLTPSLIKRSNLRNDSLVNQILDSIEQTVESK